jgi:hypothetical protein
VAGPLAGAEDEKVMPAFYLVDNFDGIKTEQPVTECHP